MQSHSAAELKFKFPAVSAYNVRGMNDAKHSIRSHPAAAPARGELLRAGPPSRAGFHRGVELTGPAGRLEAVLNQGAPHAPVAALVCHPHPLGGGTMHNKVVYHAMKVLNAPEWGFQLPVLRFNFRGVGRSQGQHDGAAETGDVETALAWLDHEFHVPVLPVGFSFGAAMVLATVCAGVQLRSNVHALALLGLPVEAAGRSYSHPFLGACPLPKLFLSGERDRFAPAPRLTQLAATAADPKRLVLVPAADHFFTGHLQAMQQALASWLKEQMP